MNWFKSRVTPKELTLAEIKATRKKAYIESLDTRQTGWYNNFEGASHTEVVLTLEARINTLEEKLRVLKAFTTVSTPVAPAYPLPSFGKDCSVCFGHKGSTCTCDKKLPKVKIPK